MMSWGVSGLSLCGAAATSYSAFFNNGNGSGSEVNASLYNWAAAIGAAGSLDQSLALPDSVGVGQGAGSPAVGGQSTANGFLYAQPDGVPGAMLLHTTSSSTSTSFQDSPQSDWFRIGSSPLAGVTVGSISRLSVFTRSESSGGVAMRFAIRANGVWYVSNASYVQTDANMWERRVINPVSSLWRSGAFVAGTSLDVDISDNPLVTLNPADIVSGYGLYADTGVLSGNAARVSIDDFEVTTSNIASNDVLVNYAGDSGAEEFKDVAELSDGTVIVAGSAENLDWISAPKTQISPLTIPNRNTGRTAFLMRLSPDLQSVLGVWHLPAGQALDFRWIKTTNKPGAPTGSIYLSGRCDAVNGDYFIAKLDNNFITDSPTGFSWVKVAKATGSFGDNLGLQTWDVGGDGRVAYVDETGTTIRVFFLNGAGAPLKLNGLRGSHWSAGATLDDVNRQEGVGSDLPATSISGISFPADLRSWTEPDRLAVLPDGNGSIKRGTWPMDLFYPVQDKLGTTSGTIEYGYTGYKSVSKYGIGGIAFNRDTNDFSIGFNIQSRFWDSPANKEQPDFEPAVISYSSTGSLKWWSRLYAEVVDANGNGVIDSGETRVSSPDQYVDGLTVDHSTSPSRLVVNARCHGNNSSNLWDGNKVAAKPGGSGFHNQFTGTEGNIHLGWIGKFRETDGNLSCATYLAGYFRNSTLTQSLYPEPIHDGWPSHKSGWPNLTTTRAQPGSIRTDASGRVYIVGIGPRMVTTSNAYQKLPKITNSVNEGISPWANFARVFDPDLLTLVYSTALTGAWTYPAVGSNPEGADNTDLYGIFPTAAGLITVGRQRATATVSDGNAVPVSNVPAWGKASPSNVAALFARLPFNPAPPSVTAPTITQGPSCNPSLVTGTSATLSVLGSDSNDGESSLAYTWFITSGPLGGSATFSPNSTNSAKTSTATFTRAGVYTLRVLITDPGNQSIQGSVNIIVNATPSSLIVSPGVASVNNGSSTSFLASASDQFGDPVIGPAINWSVSGGGVISSAGVYSAQTVGGPFIVTAAAGGLSASAQVTVNSVPLPEIDLPATSITQSAALGSTVSRQLTINNLGSAPLTWSASVSSVDNSVGGNISSFKTSLQSGGPVYSWIDITSGSTTLWAPSGSTQNDDESKSFNFPSGFTFPHYGTPYASVRVSTNGFLNFGNSFTNYINTGLPNTSAPPNLIAAAWTDWIIDSSSWVKWKAVDADTVVVTWNNVLRLGQNARATFQVILKRSGDIYVQVKSYSPADRKYTVGIQDGDRTADVEAAFDPATDFIPTGPTSSFAIYFPVPAIVPNWLAIPLPTGTVAASSSGGPQLVFNATGLAQGSYGANVTIQSNDIDESSLTVPVTLVVNSSSNASPSLTINQDSAVLPPNLGVTGAVSDTDGTISSVQVFINNVLAGSAVLGTGNWSFVFSNLPSGNYTILARATDNSGNTTDASRIIAQDGNIPPIISNIGDQTISQNTSTAALAFSIGDDTTPAADLVVSVSSSNTTLLPVTGILIGGSGAFRSVTLTPTSGQTGVSTVTLSVTDAGGKSGSVTLTLTVTSALVPTSMVVLPNWALVTAGGSKQFTAVVRDQFGIAMPTQPAITWTTTGGNSVNSSGLVTAGSSVGVDTTIIATSGTVFGSAQLVILASQADPNAGISGKRWQGGDPAWSQPDGNSFGGDSYSTGADVVFGNTGIGAVTEATTVTPRHLNFVQTDFSHSNITANYRFDPSIASPWNASGDVHLRDGFTVLNARSSGAASYQASGALQIDGGVMLGLLRNNNDANYARLTVGSMAEPGPGKSLVCNNYGNTTTKWGTTATEPCRVIVTGNKPVRTNGMISPRIQFVPSVNATGDFMDLVNDSGIAPGNNLVPLLASNYTTGFTTATDEIARISTATTLAANEICNAVRVDSALNLGGFTLTPASGGFISTSTTTSNGTLAFGTTRAAIGAYNQAAQSTISAKISGSVGITILGASQTLNVTNDTNDFTGGIAINGGSVAFTNTAANGNDIAISAIGRLTSGNSSTVDVGAVTGSGRIAALFQGSSTSSSTIRLTVPAGSSEFRGSIANGDAGRVLSLTKRGPGQQTFSGTATYTGTTAIEAGALLVDGNFSAATGAVTVDSDAILGGSGVLGGAVTVNGRISPGTSGLGRLIVVNNVTWNGSAGNEWPWQLGVSNGSDGLSILGNFSKGSGTTFKFDLSNTGSPGTYSLVDWTGNTNFAAANFSCTNIPTGLLAEFSIVGKQLQLVVSSNVPVLSPFESWKATAFPGQVSAEDRAPDSDPDGDGLKNLIEYALGLDPMSFSKMPAMVTVVENGEIYLEWHFTRPTGRADVTLVGEASDNLNFWQTGESEAVIRIEPGAGASEIVVLRDQKPYKSVARRYLRVKASL
ncbi:MAG: autotransporter-associated beta strand repeat-containing protein [Luteolibacter sp.]